MRLVDSASFLAWADAHGIGRHPRYPRSEDLVYPTDEGTWYRYRVDKSYEDLERFVDRAARVAAAGRALWIYPPARGGHWVGDVNDRAKSLVAPLVAAMNDVGVPRGYVGAVQLDPADYAQAARLLTAVLECSHLQLAIVPDHGQCILSTEFDDAIVGDFPHEQARQSFTRALRAAGWQEPPGPDPRVSEADPWLDL